MKRKRDAMTAYADAVMLRKQADFSTAAKKCSNPLLVFLCAGVGVIAAGLCWWIVL